jgi:hypothetical protein
MEFFALFILVGIILIAFGLFTMRRETQSSHWPGVEGKIISSQVKVTDMSDRIDYKAEIEYEYTVNGQTYRGTRLSVDPSYVPSRSYAEGITQRYPVGRVVTVYYDPDNFAVAVLEKGIQGRMLILLVVGAFFVFIGGVNQLWGSG